MDDSLSHYGWIILSIISSAAYLVWSSAFLKKNPALGSSAFIAITHALSGLMLLPLLDLQPVLQANGADLWHNILMVGLLAWLSKLLYFYAYSKTTVANTTIFSALTPIYAALAASFMGAALAGHQMAGIIISCLAIAFFFYQKGRESSQWPQHFSLPVACAFLSTIPTAFSIYFQKDAILQSNVYFVSFTICIFAAVASGLRHMIRPAPLALSRHHTLALLGIAFLQTLAIVAFSSFMTEGHPAVGQSLQRLSMLLQIVLAHYFLHERLNTGRHLFCAALSALGIAIMFLPL